MDAGTDVTPSIRHRYPLCLRQFDVALSPIRRSRVQSVTLNVQHDPVFGRPSPLTEPWLLLGVTLIQEWGFFLIVVQNKP